MPNSTKRCLIEASVVLGMAAILLAMATTIGIVSVTGQAPVRAPQLSSTETKSLFRGETDFWLREHQQLRRPFFGELSDRRR